MSINSCYNYVSNFNYNIQDTSLNLKCIKNYNDNNYIHTTDNLRNFSNSFAYYIGYNNININHINNFECHYYSNYLSEYNKNFNSILTIEKNFFDNNNFINQTNYQNKKFLNKSIENESNHNLKEFTVEDKLHKKINNVF